MANNPRSTQFVDSLDKATVTASSQSRHRSAFLVFFKVTSLDDTSEVKGKFFTNFHSNGKNFICEAAHEVITTYSYHTLTHDVF